MYYIKSFIYGSQPNEKTLEIPQVAKSEKSINDNEQNLQNSDNKQILQNDKVPIQFENKDYTLIIKDDCIDKQKLELELGLELELELKLDNVIIKKNNYYETTIGKDYVEQGSGIDNIIPIKTNNYYGISVGKDYVKQDLGQDNIIPLKTNYYATGTQSMDGDFPK